MVRSVTTVDVKLQENGDRVREDKLTETKNKCDVSQPEKPTGETTMRNTDEIQHQRWT